MSMNRNMIKRSVVTLAGSDDTDFPIQQVTYNGNTANVEMISPYGLHANLSAQGDTLCTMFSVEGQEDYRVAMGYTPQLRPKELAEGEVVLYHPITESQVYFRNNGDIDIETTGLNGDLNIKTRNDIKITIEGAATITSVGDISITAPNINIEGDVNIEGNLDVTGTSTASDHDSDGISGKTHTHGGVQTGAGSTGVPQ